METKLIRIDVPVGTWVKTKQVNKTTTVDGNVYLWISDWSSDGYVGELIDTQYLDGADTTDWCVFKGTQEECEKYITLKT